MARQFSVRDFLRLAPRPLLERYFHDKGLLTDLTIASLLPAKIDAVFDGWRALPEAAYSRVYSDFELVHMLADEVGLKAILERGEQEGLDLVRDFNPMQGFLEKALWTFIEYPGVAEIAYRFCEADRYADSYRLRRRDGVTISTPREDAKVPSELAQAVGRYFQLKEGRGRQCDAEVYARRGKVYYFVFPEDYGRTELEYEGSRRRLRARRPIFQVVFVFDPEQGALDTIHRGDKRARAELEKIFSRVVLGTDLEPWSDNRVYDLNLFKRKNFSLRYDPASGIRDVRVKLLRLSLLGGGSRRLTLEADPSERKGAVYDLLDTAFTTNGHEDADKFPLTLANVAQVGLVATFARDGRRGRNTKTFFLRSPNGCTLGTTARDEVLRQMLIDSKIERSDGKANEGP